ncbi:MAG: MFS transporter, partial [Thermoproteota archaeon]|nr:MFS transporter [Thermoproteota archaeon]
GGFFADLVGRKRVAVAGFVALGIAYAILGFFPDMLIFQWFYSIVGAVAWGMFTTVFLMTIWADLSQSTTREKYYAIGGMPFLLSGVIPLLAEPYSKEISVHAAFSLASFFLFLAVLPLMYAPETLPEKKIQLRKLRKYVEEAKKKAEKERAKKKR